MTSVFGNAKWVVPVLVCCGMISSLVASDIVGSIHSITGETVSGARIVVPDSGVLAVSDAAGNFTLPLDLLPVEIEVSHPDYLTRTVELDTSLPRSFRIEIVPRDLLREEVVVSARLPRPGFSPAGSAASPVDIEAVTLPDATLTGLVTEVPGVAPNGQAGLFQVYSIRGISRQRILTSVGGVRITSERRAGTSASFLDSFLMEGADILRGPSSAFYGSGALGGIVDVRPRRFQDWNLDFGYRSAGHENYLAGGWGDSSWSVGFVRRQASNAVDPEGGELNSHFTQYSGVISKRWDLKDHKMEFLLVPTYGEDIGKANTDYPSKTTNYPRERHLIARFRVESQNLWNFQAFLHPQDLTTRKTSGESVAEVFNNSLDMGLRGGKEFWIGGQHFLRIGADYFSRRGVDSTERRNLPVNGLSTWKSLDNASEDELGLNTSVNVNLNRLSLEGGGRFSLFRQANGNSESVSDTSWSGFGGGRFSFSEHLDLSASVGTGFRFAGLSERFFTGTTGRGQVIGNPGLDPERSLTLEAGARWITSKLLLSGFVFRNRIRNYIERIEIEPDLFSFVNLTDGVIRGVEWEGVYHPRNSYQFFLRGHHVQGTDHGGRALSDIPVDRIEWGFRNEAERIQYGFEWEYRHGKNRPGSGEKPIPSTHLVSAFMRFLITPALRGSISATNLLNRKYYSSADEKTPLAPGAGLALGVSWMAD